MGLHGSEKKTGVVALLKRFCYIRLTKLPNMKKLLLSALCLAAYCSLAAQQNEQNAAGSYRNQAANSTQTASQLKSSAMDKWGEPTSKWRFSLNADFSYRTAKHSDEAKYDDDLKKFENRMRPGYGFSADAHHFFWNKAALGLRSSMQFHSTTEGDIKEKLNVFFIGPSFIYREFTRSNNGAFTIAYSMGYTNRMEKYDINYGFGEKVSNGGFGYNMELGYDIRVGANQFIGINLSVFGSEIKIKEYDIKDNLESVVLSVGYKF